MRYAILVAIWTGAVARSPVGRRYAQSKYAHCSRPGGADGLLAVSWAVQCWGDLPTRRVDDHNVLGRKSVVAESNPFHRHFMFPLDRGPAAAECCHVDLTGQMTLAASVRVRSRSKPLSSPHGSCLAQKHQARNQLPPCHRSRVAMLPGRCPHTFHDLWAPEIRCLDRTGC